MKKPKRKTPTDSTLRNVRAANKRIAALELQVRCLTLIVRALRKDILSLIEKTK